MSHIRNLLKAPTPMGGAPETRHPDPIAPSSVSKNSILFRALSEPAANPASLADIPLEEAYIRPESRLVLHSDPDSAAADRFRYLCMRLRELQKAARLKTLLVTSPLSGEGKSTVAINLASALSEKGKKSVLLVEADLQRGSIPQDLGLKRRSGLAESLLNPGIPPLTHVRRIDTLGWYFLPAGEFHGNAGDVLQTRAFGNLIDGLYQTFDWIVIDSPPTICRTDAIVLQQHADATLLVLRAGSTSQADLTQALALLGRRKIAAIVLNSAQESTGVYYGYRDDQARSVATLQSHALA